MNNRYASVHLKIEKEMPSATSMPNVLHTLGLSTQTQEVLWVIAYDSLQNIRTIVEVGRGNYHEMDVPIPAVMAVPLLAGCDRFEIAHNHPSGDVAPTVMDVDLTHKILAAANTCGMYLEDHIIMGPSGKFYSFLDSGRLAPGRRSSAGHRRAS